jgi:hypothetical protein
MNIHSFNHINGTFLDPFAQKITVAIGFVFHECRVPINFTARLIMFTQTCRVTMQFRARINWTALSFLASKKYKATIFSFITNVQEKKKSKEFISFPVQNRSQIVCLNRSDSSRA